MHIVEAWSHTKSYIMNRWTGGDRVAAVLRLFRWCYQACLLFYKCSWIPFPLPLPLPILHICLQGNSALKNYSMACKWHFSYHICAFKYTFQCLILKLFFFVTLKVFFLSNKCRIFRKQEKKFSLYQYNANVQDVICFLILTIFISGYIS